MDIIAGEALPAVHRSQTSASLAGVAVLERIEQHVLVLISDELEVGKEVQPVFRPVALGKMLEWLAWV
jgi:hypothetical protein